MFHFGGLELWGAKPTKAAPWRRGWSVATFSEKFTLLRHWPILISIRGIQEVLGVRRAKLASS